VGAAQPGDLLVGELVGPGLERQTVGVGQLEHVRVAHPELVGQFEHLHVRPSQGQVIGSNIGRPGANMSGASPDTAVSASSPGRSRRPVR
jgi:hypothetical protein